MSHNRARQSLLDTRLPEELAQFESSLARMSLPPSRVNRDELIYRAGWAAAQVRGGKRGRSTFTWSVTSAALAASLAVAITLGLGPASDSPALSPTGEIADVPRGGESDSRRESTPSSEGLANVSPIGFTGTGVSWNASLLIMRDRALLQQWDDPSMVSGAFLRDPLSDDNVASQPKTSREMLRELLPAPSARIGTQRQLLWPWKTNRLGDTT